MGAPAVEAEASEVGVASDGCEEQRWEAAGAVSSGSGERWVRRVEVGGGGCKGESRVATMRGAVADLRRWPRSGGVGTGGVETRVWLALFVHLNINMNR
jgi:hypothetical protein